MPGDSWRRPAASPTVRCVDPDNLPGANIDEPERPVSARRTPGPRRGSSPSAAPSPDPGLSGLGGPPDLGAAETQPMASRTLDSLFSTPRERERRTEYRAGGDQRSEYRASDVPAEPTVPTNIYRARRPAVAVGLIIPAVFVALLLIRGLAIAGFRTPFQLGGVIASSLGLAALPLLVSGLYGLITGAAHGAEQWGFRVWARPPLAYLMVGMIFAITAGIAIR
jgi:hypothetical protein